MILGTHTLIEAHGCPLAVLENAEQLRMDLLEAVKQAGGTIVKDVFHHFSPYGLSGVIVISESHATIHTWPEHGYAALDVFTCGSSFRHEVFVTEVQRALQAGKMEHRTFQRGHGEGID